MNYEFLNKLYYKDNKLFEKEYEYRKNSPYSISLGLEINGGEAFYVNLPEFIIQMPKLYKKYAELSKLCAELPRVAFESYQRKCLIDEIILTNDIEGIRSTRKEIINVLDNENKSTKKKRFDGMVWKYVLLLDNPDKPYNVDLKNSKDIRNLYNDIVLDEINKTDWPDGEIFRKDIAEVVSGTQQVKHIGVHPESKIINYIDKSLSIFDNGTIPALYKIAILHYMIGYIHPFYDGNGRLSRFISSYLLKQEFNTLVALRLSYTIKNNKSEYYKAFDTVNDPHNKGDLTPFIIYFSTVVEQSLDSLIERLNDGNEILKYYSKALKMKYADLDPKEQKKTKDVLWYLVQNELFSNEAFDKKYLAKQLKISPETAHRYITNLINSGAPIEIEKSSRKFIYKLDSKKLLDYLI
ncbi:MAG: Fic family protein [Anaerovoracaceae bacterium]